MKRTLNRRDFVVCAGAAGFAALTGLPKLRGQDTSGKLTLVPLPDPLENCNLIWDASAFGYRVDEYLVSGSGTTFAPISDVEAGKADRPNTSVEWGHRDTAYAANLPADCSPRPQTGTGTYTTRIIGYRPRDMKKFSGNLIVEPVHPAGGIEVFSVANHFFLTRGDAVVHIDTPGRFPSDKKFSDERYGRLSMPDRSLFWTSISQVATLLKVGGPNSPLPVPARHLYMTGYSGSADTVYTFLSYHHKLTRLPDGKPVFSGYLPMSHIMPVPPIDAVIVTTATQSDMFGATDGDTPVTSAFRAKFNSDAPEARRRRYELPGAFHAPFQAPEAGMAIPLHHYEPGNFAPCSEAQKWPADALPNHVPNRAMLEACFYHASRWAVDGIVPPHAPPIDVDANGVTVKDENGNVKGGLRFPDIEVPVETFISAARGGARSCASTGYSIAFSREKLVSLYGSREQYLARYDAVADNLVKDGYILHEGAAQLKSNRRWLAPVF